MYFFIQDEPFRSFRFFDVIGTSIHFYGIGVPLCIGSQICNFCSTSLLFVNTIRGSFQTITAVPICHFWIRRLFFQVHASFLLFFHPYDVLLGIICYIDLIPLHVRNQCRICLTVSVNCRMHHPHPICHTR